MTFGGTAGRWRFIVPAANQRAPRPRSATTGQWLHVPFGGNKFVTDGSHLHTILQPQGGIVVVDDAAYAIFEGLYDRFGALVIPKWGTFTARLAQLDVVPYADGSFRGAVTWEWA